MSNKWMKQLKKHEAYVDHTFDPYNGCIRSPSPGVNWLFANKASGVPKGSGILFFAEKKAGKSLLAQAFVEELHKNDPEAIAICYNSEYKGKFQKGLFKGIDPERYIIYDTSKPADIFDHLAYEIQPLVQDGMPLKLVIIDSVTQIGGVKADGKSVEDHLMGDKALTVTRGYDNIIPFLKKNGITYITIAQIRANLGVMYGPDVKAAIPKACEHNHEYFISLKKATAADDKKDIEGKSFENDEIKDARGNKLITGHKAYVKMEENSLGSAGRSVRITISYKDGIINKHEEIFELAKNCGILERPNNRTFKYKDQQWVGKSETAKAILNDPELAQQLLQDIMALDG